MTGAVVPLYRYVVMDGSTIIITMDNHQDALSAAHFYEVSQVQLYDRLCICDIIPIRNRGGKNVANT